MDRETARQEIRQRWREIITHYTTEAKRKVAGEITYVCPFCKHGKGGDGLCLNPKSKDGNGIKCFGCDFAGDILDLIQQYKGYDHNEALQEAADILGITIDSYRRTSNAAQINDGWKQHKAASDTAEEHADIITRAADDQKTKETQEQAIKYIMTCANMISGSPAEEYILNRGFSAEDITNFELGYDPIRNGLVIPYPDTDGYYITRIMHMEGTGKYKKPADITEPLFTAGRESDDIVFISEGQLNALSLIKAGAGRVAATGGPGTSKLEALKGCVKGAVIVPDNDEAGEKTAQRIKDKLDELGIFCRVIHLPEGYNDSNDILKEDPDRLREDVEKSRNWMIEKIHDDQADPVADQGQQEEPEQLPGLLTAESIIEEFSSADDRILELKSFPEFSKLAKIRLHSSIVLAADTGAGKSSLAINFLHDLSETYPTLYFNLEMDRLTVLRRLTAIHSGIELDRIEGYKNDQTTAAAVNIAIKEITSKKPIQVVNDTYTLEEIEAVIKTSTEGRKDPTIVFVDHSLLVDTENKTVGRYERFTRVSEGLRKIALNEKYNIILFVLLQQNRAGKENETERPKNSSLKESGSWENDGTHICFLWYDPTTRKKKLILTKNRSGDLGEVTLDYYRRTQTYREAKDQEQKTATPMHAKQSKRDKQREKLLRAFEAASVATGGNPTLQDMAEAADVSTRTVRGWIKEYGGATINGKQIDPAGSDTEIDVHGFIRLTASDEQPPQEDLTTGGRYRPAARRR